MAWLSSFALVHPFLLLFVLCPILLHSESQTSPSTVLPPLSRAELRCVTFLGQREPDSILDSCVLVAKRYSPGFEFILLETGNLSNVCRGFFYFGECMSKGACLASACTLEAAHSFIAKAKASTRKAFSSRHGSCSGKPIPGDINKFGCAQDVQSFKHSEEQCRKLLAKENISSPIDTVRKTPIGYGSCDEHFEAASTMMQVICDKCDNQNAIVASNFIRAIFKAKNLQCSLRKPYAFECRSNTTNSWMIAVGVIGFILLLTVVAFGPFCYVTSAEKSKELSMDTVTIKGPRLVSQMSKTAPVQN